MELMLKNFSFFFAKLKFGLVLLSLLYKRNPTSNYPFEKKWKYFLNYFTSKVISYRSDELFVKRS